MIKYIFIVYLLISCSSPEKEEQHFSYKFSEKRSILLDQLSLVPEYPFPPYQIFQQSDSIIFYNSFTLGLSSLTLKNDQFEYDELGVFEEFGASTEGTPFFLSDSKNYIGIWKLPNINLYDKNLSYLKKINLSDLEIIKDYNSPYFKGPNSFQIGLSFNAVNFSDNKIYIFSTDTEDDALDLFSLNLTNDSLEILPGFYDKELITSQKIQYQGFSLDHLPFVLYENNKLIISYYYHSKIEVLDLNTHSSLTREIKTEAYPDRKVIKPIFPQGTTIMEAWDLTDDREGEVAFGELHYWESCGCFYRTVKGPIKSEKLQDFDVFLEMFDKNFEKTDEVNLSAINPNVSNFTIPLNGKLLIKAKSQTNEDVLDYYFLEVEVLK